MGFSLSNAPNGVWYGWFSHFNSATVAHAVSTRLGGRSQAPFATLNLGLHTGDAEDAVRLNRKMFCQATGIELSKVVTAEQVHGSRVMLVEAADAGKGAYEFGDALAAADALITNTPDLPLLLFFADCVPVLIVDPVNKAIGVSHAGWKGTVAKIAQKTVLAMRDHFGTRPQECLVGIAPSIGPCCYEVDDVVASQCKAQFEHWQAMLKPEGEKWRLNLWLANQIQLAEIGVLTRNIEISGVCTACNTSLFFSYRAERGLTGRIGAVISLKG